MNNRGNGKIVRKGTWNRQQETNMKEKELHEDTYSEEDEIQLLRKDWSIQFSRRCKCDSCKC